MEKQQIVFHRKHVKSPESSSLKTGVRKRNIVLHEYANVNLGIVWNTVQSRVLESETS
ncbi:HepT-like ribonuclease domain-containing protein [Gloeocapsopsis dulcis]|uniref:HepT-like ribonuclease domain-containing protein n=1 Tax=Gloeocapsopsis dulcis TaxID=2859516 RepID=UPI00101AD7EA